MVVRFRTMKLVYPVPSTTENAYLVVVQVMSLISLHVLICLNLFRLKLQRVIHAVEHLMNRFGHFSAFVWNRHAR